MKNNNKVCPICGQKIDYSAISRSNNKICPDCGTLEGLEDFMKRIVEIKIKTYDEIKGC